MGSFIDNDDAFGPETSRAARWQFAVSALDNFVPNWFQKEGRRVVGGMGQAAARAIESLVTRSRELARERDEAQRQLAERPVTYKVPPRKHYAYNAQLAGADENAPYRWATVVRFLDKFIPSWAPPVNREENAGLGAAAREALEKLIEERDDARAKLEKLRNLDEKRQRDKAGAMGAMYGSNNPQFDLYAMAAEYMRRPAKLQTENNYPEWKDSYTKRVIDQLHSAQWKVAHGGLKTSIVDAAIRAATDLLRDYHATNHEVYAQRNSAVKERDEAQKTLEVARKDIAALIEQRNAAMNERDNLRGRIKRATNELTINRIIPPAPPPGEYVDLRWKVV